jgi:hypothetical protein
MVRAADSLSTTADVFGLFEDDQGILDLLAELGQRDRSSAVRYGDSQDRRAHLDRVVERLQLDDERQRYRELSDRIDERLGNGQAISDELRAEFEALVAKLKR